VSEVFDLSASNSLIAPSFPILLTVSSENEMKQQVLHPRSSEARDGCVSSASDNLFAPAVPI
jgi:hypothetical protein